MRYYELMWILGADADDDSSEQSAQAVESRIDDRGGEVLRYAAWGRRSLAYPIDHNTEGIYNVLQFSMEPEQAVAFEKEVLADQAIIRHAQVRIEEVDLLPVAPPPPPERAESPEPPEPPEPIKTEAAGD